MKYGLIGEHLKHSYSCEIHSLIADYEYQLCELRPEELGDFLTRRDFDGINVTIPYKEAVMQYLDEVSDIAKEIGAVNTIVNREGKLVGTNTDYYGMLSLIKRLDINGEGKKFMILGSGGTSKTAQRVAKTLGAGEIILVSRSQKAGYITYEEAKEKYADVDYLINTTPAGMFPNVDEKPIGLDGFTKLKAVVDVVYNPLRTELVLDANSKDIQSTGGLYMLAAQAVYAKAEFLNEKVNLSDIDRAFSEVCDLKGNLVLIGMPTSGKTTIGKLIAEETGKEFVDTDEIIISKIDMPIAEFFKLKGEEEFRKIEGQIIEELSLSGGKVIATGGGSVLRQENIRNLKRNGTVIFLDRNLDKLTASKDRPLASDREALAKLYDERHELYEKCADIIVDGNGSVAEVAGKIKEKYEHAI